MTRTQKPEAQRLADTVERFNAGVHSQAIAEEYSAAARELRRQHDRITDLEEKLRREVRHSTKLEAARIAYASEFKPDAVRVPLDSLHADAGYLCGRLLDGTMTQEQVVASIRRRIDEAKEALK